MGLQVIIALAAGGFVLVALLLGCALAVASARGDRIARERLVDMHDRHGQERLP